MYSFSPLFSARPCGIWCQFFQAAAAAGGGSMLCHKNRMSTHGRLFAIAGDVGRGPSGIDKVPGMVQYPGQSVTLQIAPLVGVKLKTVPERRTL
ncbi:hypothetical protein KB20921_24190 [Edwardsiella ictaluri]|nr:hypothetical protein KH20906_24000 [Edwardsiella ictaluri]BEI03158.1 hypothetical protein KB20921_24190 [Edwardsiella ictaluri]BEI06619.1 hypothetical protein KH201010_24050 [Edwardsiella ictaluri]BEI10083.1 hypothetical protein STU22726_24140 [Edwardsiella ictaluri]BEI13562.1 hypothetical protein STU22816_24150 [Edwardsiella ictaluri]